MRRRFDANLNPRSRSTPRPRQRRLISRAIALTFAVLATLILASCGAPSSFNPVTKQGNSVNDLFIFVLILSAFVFLLVICILIYVMIRYREHGAEASTREGNRRLEITWIVIPFLVLTLLFVLSVRVQGRMTNSQTSPLVIKVIGHQWWWEYQYPSLQVTTANELHLPVDTPVKLEITGNDVIHSFWVPKFGWKQDAIPGKTNTMQVKVDKAGTYDGTCTEYCGAQHAWMRIRVIAQDKEDFDSWARIQRQPGAAPVGSVASRGQQVFLESTCVNCHTVAGTAAQGNVGPDLTHIGSRTTIGAGVLSNTPANMTKWIRDVQEVKPSVLMPRYPNLSPDDLKALVTYLEGLK